MANLNKENIITVDVKNATVKTEGSMSFYITDIKTCNIYCQLVINESKSTLVKNYAPIENAEDFSITLRLIKPNNEPKELSFSLLNQVEAFFYVDLTDEYKDCIGTYNCELFVDCLVNGELERITTSSFSYRVNASIMNKLDDVIDNMQSNPLIETLATKEYVDNIVYVIDKTEAEEGITYEDFKNGGCTCKLSGSLYFGNTYFTFDDELVYVVKTDYSNMKKLYVYRITTVARPGGGAAADYIILDYREGTYEAYNYMLEEIENKADQVKLDLMNIIDDANYAPVAYVNDSMKVIDETAKEYVNNRIEDIVNDINTAEYATESHVNESISTLRTNIIDILTNNYATKSEMNTAINEALGGTDLSNYATHSYVSNFFNNSIDNRLEDYATKESVSKVSNDLLEHRRYVSVVVSDFQGQIDWIMEDWAKIEYVNQKIAEAQLGGEGGTVDLSQYATKDYVHEYVSNNAGSGGGSDDYVSWDSLRESYYDKDYISSNYPTWDHLTSEISNASDNIYSTLNSDYATREWVSEYMSEHGGGSTPDLSDYATKEYVSDRISTFKYEDLPEMGYATKEYVQEYVSENGGGGSSDGISYDDMTMYVDQRLEAYDEILSERGYITSSSLNNKGYITSENLSERFLELKNEYLPEYYATIGYIDNKLSDIETLLGEI